jgi:predicted lipid-binding transport protein (Tim44 family)
MEGQTSLDILFFAVVAAYLIYRLYKVLGSNDGAPPAKKPGALVFQEEGGAITIKPVKIPKNFDKLTQPLSKITELDSSFDLQTFIERATGAFEIIIEAFNQGDKETLKSLLSSEIYRDWSNEISKRKTSKETLEHTLERVQKVDLVDISVRATVAKIKLKFVSEQIFAFYDEEGNLVEGDPDTIEILTDIWTFKRDLISSDPQWILVEAEQDEASTPDDKDKK